MKFEKYTQFLKEGASAIIDGKIEVSIVSDVKSDTFASDFGVKIYESPKFKTNGVLYIGGDLKFWNVPTGKKRAGLPGLNHSEVTTESIKELTKLIPSLKTSLKQLSEEYLEKVSALFEEAGFEFGTDAQIAKVTASDEPKKEEPKKEKEDDSETKTLKKNSLDLSDLEDF